MELLEIEKELKGPGGEAALARYDAVLVGLDERLEAALQQGVAPEAFARCEALRDVIVTARKLLRLQCREQ